MNVLIETFGSAGDVHPFVGVGRGLAARGHDVTLLTNEKFGHVVEGAGLGFVAVGDAESFDAVLRDPDLWHPQRGLRLLVREGIGPHVRAALPELQQRIVPGETLLIGSTLGFASRILRDAVDVPMLTLHLAPSTIRSNIRPPRLPGLWMPPAMPTFLKDVIWWVADKITDSWFCPPLDAARAGLSLPPVKRVFADWCHSPDGVIALFPAWFAPPPADWPERVTLTGFPLYDEADQRPRDDDMERWLEAGDSPVVVTAGSANVHGQGVFRASIEACRALGRRALLVTTERSSLPATLPDHCRHSTYVPFSEVLPRAAALVSHGGVGTCSQALAAGVPHLVTPYAYDQFDNVSRLEELGTGVSVPATRYDAARAKAALGGLLRDSAVAAACGAARERVAAQDGLAETCDRIEAFWAGQ